MNNVMDNDRARWSKPAAKPNPSRCFEPSLSPNDSFRCGREEL